jgi:hypothetical protein
MSVARHHPETANGDAGWAIAADAANMAAAANKLRTIRSSCCHTRLGQQSWKITRASAKWRAATANRQLAEPTSPTHFVA